MDNDLKKAVNQKKEAVKAPLIYFLKLSSLMIFL